MIETEAPSSEQRKGVRLNILQQTQLRLLGYTQIGEIKKKGWKGTLPLYAIICEKHGLVTDYPHGFEGRLTCPICSKVR